MCATEQVIILWRDFYTSAFHYPFQVFIAWRRLRDTDTLKETWRRHRMAWRRLRDTDMPRRLQGMENSRPAWRRHRNPWRRHQHTEEYRPAVLCSEMESFQTSYSPHTTTLTTWDCVAVGSLAAVTRHCKQHPSATLRRRPMCKKKCFPYDFYVMGEFGVLEHFKCTEANIPESAYAPCCK